MIETRGVRPFQVRKKFSVSKIIGTLLSVSVLSFFSLASLTPSLQMIQDHPIETLFQETSLSHLDSSSLSLWGLEISGSEPFSWKLPYEAGPPLHHLSQIILETQNHQNKIFLGGPRPLPQGLREVRSSALALWTHRKTFKNLLGTTQVLWIQGSSTIILTEPSFRQGILFSLNSPSQTSSDFYYSFACSRSCLELTQTTLKISLLRPTLDEQYLEKKKQSLKKIEKSLHALTNQEKSLSVSQRSDLERLLISYLSLEPRHFETYFHLGKISPEHRSDMIQYLDDLQAPQEYRLELSSSATHSSH